MEEETKEQNSKSKVVGGVISTIISILIVIFIFTSCNLFGDDAGTNNTKYYIGDTVSNGNVSVKVTSVENTQNFDYFYSTENNFVVIYFTVINQSNSAISINPLYCSLKMGETSFEDVTYDYDVFDIVAGGTKSGLYLVYETVKTTNQATYIVELGYSLLNTNCFKIILKDKPSV